MSGVALITIAHGRQEHWARQCAALERGSAMPDQRILVTMDDRALGVWTRRTNPAVDVVALPRDPRGLPLARARNVGAERAIEAGADVLVFLDVDCLPGHDLVAAYAHAARDTETTGLLLSGPVTYLPPDAAVDDPAVLAERDDPHPARPAPREGEVLFLDRPELFWSLSFAVTVDVWRRLGGFCESYIGYGGEDTDLGYTAAATGIGMAWVGSGRAYHQHHAVESPPVRHLDAILENGRVFAERWGEWPMTGWLDEFARLGLVERRGDGSYRRVAGARFEPARKPVGEKTDEA